MTWKIKIEFSGSEDNLRDLLLQLGEQAKARDWDKMPKAGGGGGGPTFSVTLERPLSNGQGGGVVTMEFDCDAACTSVTSQRCGQELFWSSAALGVRSSIG